METRLSHSDAIASLAFLDRKEAQVTDEVHRRAVRGMRERIVGEMTGDLALALGACDPGFTVTMHLPDGAAVRLEAREEVEGLFESLTSSVTPIVLWMTFDHIVIDGRTFATDGVTTILYTGAGARLAGLDADVDGGVYAVTQRVSTIVEFGDDGLHRHEVVYMSPDARRIERLTAPDQPSPLEIRAAVRRALGNQTVTIPS